MKSTRTYTMNARAAATAQTRERILLATFEASEDKPIAAIALPDVAERAGVSVQTILRQFGSRDGLFDAAVDFVGALITAERATTPGDAKAAVDVLLDHYETRGDTVLRLLAQEIWDERVRIITDSGREIHRRWVTEVFSPLLSERTRAELSAAIDLLVVATDLYTWKLLRRDRGLARAATHARMLRMITLIVEG